MYRTLSRQSRSQIDPDTRFIGLFVQYEIQLQTESSSVVASFPLTADREHEDRIELLDITV